MAAKEKCEHLIVGITSPDPSVSPVETADVNRSSDVANPCTYYERIEQWGYKVHVLWKKTEKGISSTMLRQHIVEDKPWKQYVPNATYEYIVANGIDKRIKTGQLSKNIN